jgi:predicted helicase
MIPSRAFALSITLDIAEAKQGGFAFLNEANTQRVERQKRTPITIIGNPPYNMGIYHIENKWNRIIFAFCSLFVRMPREAHYFRPRTKVKLNDSEEELLACLSRGHSGKKKKE